MCHLAGVLSEESVLDASTIRVQHINDRVGVPVIACCEHGHLVPLIDHLQALLNEGPDDELTEEGFVRAWFLQFNDIVPVNFSASVKAL